MVSLRPCILLATLGVFGCPSAEEDPNPATPASPATPVTAVDPDNPEACVACHQQVVEEWKQSMHARAHHDTDPIFAGMRSLRMKKQGEQIAGKCAQCHNPRDPNDPDSPAGKTAVACAACHNVEKVHAGADKKPGLMGAKALVFAQDNRMLGPHDVTVDAGVHKTGPAAPFIQDGQTICLACHDATKNPAGVAACTTGPEYAQRKDTEQSCTDCHMPRVEGPAGAVGGRKDHASHAFLGPHRAWYQDDASFLAQGVELGGSLDDGLTVTLANRSGHGFPSAFPGRVVVVVAAGKNAAGETIWRNFEDNPMKQSPQSVLNKVYVDADGNPVMPPFAQELKRDSRLEPDETRTLRFEVPPEVVSVDLEVRYRLVPQAAVGPLGLNGKPEAEPRVVTRTTVERS